MPFETFFESYKFFLTEYSDLFLTMGQNLFKGLATILIVWFGIKAALSFAEDGEGFAFSKFTGADDQFQPHHREQEHNCAERQEKIDRFHQNTGLRSICSISLAGAPNAALATSDSISRKPVHRTRPNDQKRFLIAPTQILSRLWGTLQI